MRLIGLVLTCVFLSTVSFAQSFTNLGTYTGKMNDGKVIQIELKDDGLASMEIDGVSQGVVKFAYDPEASETIRFISMPPDDNMNKAAYVLPLPIMQNGLFKKVKGKKWKLQLSDIGQDAPADFGNDAIILEFKAN